MDLSRDTFQFWVQSALQPASMHRLPDSNRIKLIRVCADCQLLFTSVLYSDNLMFVHGAVLYLHPEVYTRVPCTCRQLII